MSAADPTGPLERRYRGLLRLLPADHRAARGEELLGLLLDLDAGRSRPSSRQAVGVVGLALRLRLVRAASLLLAAFLVASSTAVVGTFYEIGTGAVFVSLTDEFPIRNVTLALLIPGLLRLGIAVAWILGARRAALAAFAALLAYSLATAGLAGLGRLDLILLVALGAATAMGWPAPRPRAALLAAIPLAMLLWTLTVASSAFAGFGYLFVAAAVVLLGTAGGLLPRRASGGSHPSG